MNGNAGKHPLRIVGTWWLTKTTDPRPGVATESGWTALSVKPQQEAAVQFLDVAPHPARLFRLETGSMADAMQALRTCTDKLLIQWGFDPAQQAALSRFPTPTNYTGKWLRPSDYPASALSRGASGIVHFRLNIEETGAVSSCHVLSMTQPAGFEDLTCRLIAERARFNPALDAGGKPVRSYFVHKAVWYMQE